MSVAMTNCGELEWISDRSGYRYAKIDPETSRPWPSMPESFRLLATTAAERIGYAGFAPDACLINRYEVGTKLSLHQDKNEGDFGKPIVSVSFGLPATFLFGGDRRSDPVSRLACSTATWLSGEDRRGSAFMASLLSSADTIRGLARSGTTSPSDSFGDSKLNLFTRASAQ